MLYKILYEGHYLTSESKERLIEYIKRMNLNDEEEEMKRIIKDDKLLEELITKEISSFAYPESE